MQDAIELLLRSDLLGGVAEADLRALDPPPEWVRLAAGETLIREGVPGEALYLLVHGRLRAFASDPSGATRTLGDVLSGECVGEMSLLSGSPTSATVRAMHESELVRFSRASYLQLIERSPEVILHITRTLIKRLREGQGCASRRLPYASIAILPIDGGIDAARFTAELTQHLREFAAEISVHEPGAPGDLGRARRDADVHLSIYRADPEPGEWTRRCLRAADLVLLVGHAGSDPALGEAERTLIRHLDPALSPRVELALLHGANWHPPGRSREWLRGREVADLHHLRQWQAEDFARLARILSGNGIGVVLSGGGARCFAQIGVLAALREAGVPVDRIAGTSMGSMIGALFAIGRSTDEIVRISRTVWIEGKPLSDYTFPALSIVRGRRLHDLVKTTLAGWDIEDLPIGFYCVSGDLSENELVLHDRGCLWEAVRASGSIPGAGPPMFRNGSLLVDGGVLNNLPVDIMRERYGGIVIAVDVAPQRTLELPEQLDDTPPSGWRLLWSRINPFARPLPIPGIFEVLYRTATIGSCRLSRLNRALADLVLAPPVAGFGTLEFRAIDELVRIGHRHAVERLQSLDGERIAPFVSRRPVMDHHAPEPAIADKMGAPARRHRRPVAAAAVAGVIAFGGWALLAQDLRLPIGISPPDAAVANEAAAAGEAAVLAPGNILPVEVATVRLVDGYEVRERYAGRLVSRRSSDLGFERTGLVVEIAVDEGMRVDKGDPIARLDVQRLEAQRAELRAELTHARAARDQTEAELELARATVQRMSSLLQTDNVSRQRYDEAMFGEQAMASQLAAKAAAIEQVSAALDALEVEIARSTIRAPFDGTIVARFLDEGTVAAAGAPVVRLIEDGIKEVRVGVPVPVAATMRIGAPYDVEIDGRTYRARLRTLLEAIDPTTRTVPALLEVELAEQHRRLRWGELARLQLDRTLEMQGSWLPTSALIGGRRGLWVVYALERASEGEGLMRIARREVQILHSEDGRSFVRGTLRDGESIVASGLHRVVPNQLVRVDQPVPTH